MKILNFTEFAALPSGAIYSYYQPTICEGLYRKGETIVWDNGTPGDFFEASLVASCWNGDPPTVDDCQSRWGSFNFEQLFAVYEPADIEVLRKMLTP